MVPDTDTEHDVLLQILRGVKNDTPTMGEGEGGEGGGCIISWNSLLVDCCVFGSGPILYMLFENIFIIPLQLRLVLEFFYF